MSSLPFVDTRKVLSTLTWFEPFWVLLLGIPTLLPGKIVPIHFHPYLIGALFIFCPLRWLTRSQIIKNRPLVISNKSTFPALGHPNAIPVFFLVLWTPVTIWASIDRTASWIVAGYLLLGIALFEAFVNWPPAIRNPSYIAACSLIVGTALALLSPPIVAWKPQFRLFHLPLYNQLQYIRINVGEMIHANVLAGGLVVVLPLWLALAFQRNWPHHRWLPYIASLAGFAVLSILGLTQSRGGYLAAAFGLCVILLLCFPRLLYTVPLIILGTIIAVRLIGLSNVMEQFSTDSSLGGWGGRLDIWTHSLHAVSDFPYTGIGIGTFTLVMPMLYPLRYPIEGYPHAHNLFLQIGVDMGLPGLIAYLAMLLNLFVMLITILRARHATPLQRTLAIGATGSLAAILVHGLLDAVIWGTKLAFMPWLLFALITLLFLQVQQDCPVTKA